MSKTKSTPRGRLRRAGLAVGAAATVLGAGIMAPPANAATVTVTLSPAAGPEATATPTVISATTEWLTGLTQPIVTFNMAACPTTYTTAAQTAAAVSSTTVGNVIVTNARKLSNTRLAVTVPVGVIAFGTAASQKFNTCVYASSTTDSELVGKGFYTAGAPSSVSKVTPGVGPTTGGHTITISGTGLPTTISATGIISASIDGIPLTGLKAVSSSAFTAVTPAHSATRDLTLQVNTATGTLYLEDAYDYQSGIAVTPNTAPSKAGFVDVSVTGTGFLDPTFSDTGTTNDTNGHVYLVPGIYDTSTAGNKTNGQIAECTDVLVFSANELVCRLQLFSRMDNGSANAFAAADTRSVTDAVTTGTASSPVLTSATAEFSADDVGKLVAQAGNTNVLAGSYIVSVDSATQVTLSQNAATAATGLTVVIGGDRPEVVLTAAAAIGATTVSKTTDNTFFQRDVGRRITVTGGSGTLPAGTIITAVSANGQTATISRPVAGDTVTEVTVMGEAEVVDGSYILTVVDRGDVSAAADAGVAASVVSSSSTFTVADY